MSRIITAGPNGTCGAKSERICAFCQAPENALFRERLGATLPCEHGGPWRGVQAQDGVFPTVWRKKGCKSCPPRVVR